MNKPAKLQPSQLTMILTLSAAFSVMCAAFPFTLEQLIGTAISIGLQILLCIPAFLLTRRTDSLAAHCKGHNALLAAALIAGICFYTSTLGIQTLARSSTLTFGVLLLTLAVMLLGGYRSIHLQNLAFSPDSCIWSSVLQHLSLADELPVLVLLLGFLEKQPVRSTFRFFGFSFGIWFFVLFLGITILGSFMPHAAYPFFTIASVSQPFRTQRADALYLIVFVLLCILRLTLFTTLSAHLLGEAFPKLRFRNGICLLIILGHAVGIGILGLSSSWWYIVPIVLLTVCVPWSLLLLDPPEPASQKQ